MKLTRTMNHFMRWRTRLCRVYFSFEILGNLWLSIRKPYSSPNTGEIRSLIKQSTTALATLIKTSPNKTLRGGSFHFSGVKAGLFKTNILQAYLYQTKNSCISSVGRKKTYYNEEKISYIQTSRRSSLYLLTHTPFKGLMVHP